MNEEGKRLWKMEEPRSYQEYFFVEKSNLELSIRI